MFVGEVDDVQVKAATDGVALPDDLSLALVNPGSAKTSEAEAPAEQPDAGTASYEQDYDDLGWLESGSTEGQEDGITLQANVQAKKAVAQPTIYSRAQW